MNRTTLMKFGGISAFGFVVLFTISIVAYWVTGGLEFRAWVPLWSSLVCFWFVAAIAVYDYLAKPEYALARVGLGFAILSIIILFLEGTVWGADRMVLRVQGSQDQTVLTELRALFDTLHLMVLWFIGIWYALWGAAFLRLGGRGRFIGAAMALVAIFHFGEYLLYRLGVTGMSLEIWHLGSQGFTMITYVLLGLLLLQESKVARN